MGDQALLTIGPSRRPAVRFAAAALALALASGPAAAQRPTAAPTGPASPPSTQASGGPVERARAALAAGRAAEAMALAEGVLAVKPDDRGATDVVVRVLAGRDDIDGALAVYERFVGHAKAEDAALLAPIATAMLDRLSKDPLPETAAAALEQLARGGDAKSEQRLKDLAKSRDPRTSSIHALAALVRLGDEAAAADLAAVAASGPSGSRILAIDVLSRHAPARVVPLLSSAIVDPDMMVQAAAIDAAGRAGARDLLPTLERAAAGASPFIRIYVAIAQHQLGVPGARPRLEAALTGPYADAVLLAASAFPPDDAARIAALRPLLEDENRLVAIRAAALLLTTTERPAAARVLVSAIDDLNRVVREEAALALAGDQTPDIASLHRLLRDGSTISRLRASTGILGSVKAGR